MVEVVKIFSFSFLDMTGKACRSDACNQECMHVRDIPFLINVEAFLAEVAVHQLPKLTADGADPRECPIVLLTENLFQVLVHT
jgi:hypothetical protein